MDTAQKVKVSEEAKQQSVTKLDAYYKKISNESIRQSNIIYNEAKDRTYSLKSKTESTIKVHSYSKEAERSERLRQLADHAVKTTENLKFVLEGLEEVKKA
jgi:hypothetical protein